MKKLICALIFLILTASTAYAETIASGSANGCLWHLSDTGVVTFYGEGCAIRSTDSLWDYIDEIKEIVIEDGVTGICDYAFEHYPNLRKVTIPGSIKNIGEGAFEHCSRLSEVNLGNGIEYIEMDAFMQTGIEQITIPSSVRIIGDGAFAGCSALETVTVENGVEILEGYAFSNCINLTNVTVGAKIIGECAFKHTGIQYLTLNEGVEEIKSEAFAATGITELTFPSSLTTIRADSFAETKIKDLIIPNTITTLENYAFGYMTALESIVFEEGITKIDDLAFACCPELTSVTLPKTMEQMGSGVFACCYNLSQINLSPQNEHFDIRDNCLYTTDSNKLIFYMDLNNSSDDENVINAPITIPSFITALSPYALSTAIADTITIHKDIENIEDSALYYARTNEFITDSQNPYYTAESGVLYNKSKTDLLAYPTNAQASTFEVPNGVINIKTTAFAQSQLKNVIFPDSLKTIEIAAFSCSAIENIDFGEGVETIGNGAFAICDNLREIHIPDSVVTIGKSAFENCCNLTNIALGKGIITIDDYAFKHTYITEIIIPDSVITIGDYAFENCSQLSEVQFGNKVQTIGNYSFSQTNISAISLPDSLVSLGDRAFYWCFLSHINLGYGLETIGEVALEFDYSFYDTNELVIPASVKTINLGHFRNINNITVFSTVEQIDSSIFNVRHLDFVGTEQELLKILPEDADIDEINVTYHSPATISFEIGYDAEYGFESVTVKQSSTPLLPTSVPTKKGFKFLGWATSADSYEAQYQPGNPINIGTEDVKLYALWQPLNHTNDNFRINSIQYSGDVLKIDVTKGNTLSSIDGAVVIGLYDGDKQAALHYDCENSRIQHMFMNLPAPKNNYTIKILYFDTENLTPYTKEFAVIY